MATRVCPICACQKVEILEEIKLAIPRDYHLPQKYRVVSCTKCGFCFSDTEATIEDYEFYYMNHNSYSGSPLEKNTWDHLHNTAIRLLSGHIEKDYRILDMGFGKGYFLCFLKMNGYSNIIGIDPSKNSVDKIREKGISAEVGSVFDTPKSCIGEIDCVVLFDVLEHLLNPLDGIRNLNIYLKDGGFLLVSVPNYAYLDNNIYPISNLFNQEHINYFSPISLDCIMEQCGLKRIASNLDTEKNQEEIVALYEKQPGVYRRYIENKKRDDICAASINQYLRRFHKNKGEIERKLSCAKKRKGGVYVWGTGSYVMWLLENTLLNEFTIEFVDNNKEKIGKRFYNTNILSPNQIKNEKWPIIVCSMLHSDAIIKQISDMRLTNEIIVI